MVGQKPVRIVDGEGPVPVADLEPVGGNLAAGEHRFEQASRVDRGQRDPLVADQSDHAGGVRPPDPDGHLVAVQVRPEQAVWLVMLPTDQALDLVALRGDGRHGQLPTIASRQSGTAPTPTGTNSTDDLTERLVECLAQLEGAKQ
jgi:hypothetical protein